MFFNESTKKVVDKIKKLWYNKDNPKEKQI